MHTRIPVKIKLGQQTYLETSFDKMLDKKLKDGPVDVYLFNPISSAMYTYSIDDLDFRGHNKLVAKVYSFSGNYLDVVIDEEMYNKLLNANYEIYAVPVFDATSDASKIKAYGIDKFYLHIHESIQNKNNC